MFKFCDLIHRLIYQLRLFFIKSVHAVAGLIIIIINVKDLQFMNVYQCWYLGLNGYCCRSHNSRWMFVPELGQTSSRIHKHLSLSDLVFDNPFAKQYELKIDQRHKRNEVKSIAIPYMHFFTLPRNQSTVGGMLFASI